MPVYLTRLTTVAADPVTSTTFFHETLQAVFDCLLRVGAADGDGGALGKVQAYIGMTEEQFRLTLHAHLLSVGVLLQQPRTETTRGQV